MPYDCFTKIFGPNPPGINATRGSVRSSDEPVFFCASGSLRLATLVAMFHARMGGQSFEERIAAPSAWPWSLGVRMSRAEGIFVYLLLPHGFAVRNCGMRTCVICNFDADNLDANDEYARKGKQWAVPGIPGSVYVCGRCESTLLIVFSEPWKREKRGKAAPGFSEWLSVLKRAWDSGNQCFRCQISGDRLHATIDDQDSPASPAWEHDENGQYIVVAAGRTTAQSNTT